MSDDQILQRIASDIVDIKVTIAKQEIHLAEHIRRSDLLETQVSILREEVAKSKGVKDFILFIAKVALPLGAIFAAIKRFL